MNHEPLPSVCAIIFDLDGTLIDSLSGIAGAMNLALAAQGLPIHPPDAYRFMVGDGVSHLVERALPESERVPERIREFTTAYRNAYEEVWPGLTLPFPGIRELLDRLIGRKVPFSVLSNKTHEVTCRMTRALFPDYPFAEVLGQKDGVPIKPDPQSALNLSRLMGCEPGATFFVGDSAVDMRTAANAGMIPVGVGWGMRPRHELIDNGARAVIDEARELLNYLPV